MPWSIVIVSWNTRVDLEECLRSIGEHIGFNKTSVIVIDNGSSDGSILLKDKYAQGQWILNKDNRGFARANNQARAFVKTPYVLFLNPDTIITENILPELENFFETHEQASIIGPKILNPDGSPQRSVRRFPKVWQIIFELLKGANIWPELLEKYYAFDLDTDKIQRVDQVSGSALAIKTKDLNAIGWWDEKYFLWFDEVDLCQRVKKNGGEIWYVPTVSLIHKGGASFWQWSALKRQWQFARSASHYFRKNVSKIHAASIWIFTPLWLVAGLILAILLLLPLKRKYR